MSLLRIAWRSIQQRALASALTALSVAMGVALVVGVLVIYGVVDQSFRRGAQGYDMIVGAKGSPLQLVLNTVFHLSQPVETIPYRYYEEFTVGRFSPAVELAIPVCTGHDFRGCPVIATVPDAFDKLTYLDNQRYAFTQGGNFKADKPFEAVAGAMAARLANLQLGDKFVPVAKGEVEGHGGHEPFTVVGILAPTGTPNDRTLFINLEGFYRCDAHRHGPSFEEKLLAQKATATAEPKGAADQHAHEAEEEAHRQISAILICTSSEKQQLAMALPTVVNEDTVAQAVMPSRVISELFDGIVGNIQLLLLVLAVLVVIVAGISILVSIYNSMNDRRHDIAVMRALGARRWTVMSVILTESILLSLGGGFAGLAMGHGLVAVLGPTIADQTGVVVSSLAFQPVELVLVPGLILLAALVGYLPAMSAYRTDVAKALTASP
jgi:putative ABC transport system permease protein